MARLLAGLKVLVTRPAHQAEPLCRLIEQAGGTAILLPTLTIRYLAEPANLAQMLPYLEQVDFVIFLSANAVLAVAQTFKSDWLNLMPKHTQFIAIGEGTRKALLANDLPIDLMPATQASSEGILALPALQRLPNKTIILFKGAGGRGIIAPTLVQRGAHVIDAVVYRREGPKDDIREQLITWQHQGVDAIISTSGESLANLFKITLDKKWLCNTYFVVISQRIAEQAQQLGVKRWVVAKNASDEAIVEALQVIRH